MGTPEVKILRHKSGAAVVPIHYSMDPSKDAEWVLRQKAKGTDQDWSLEMEIDFLSVVGARCFDNFNILANVDHRIEYNPNLPIYLGCDFNVEPMAWVIAQVMPNEEMWVIDEIWKNPGSVEINSDIFLNRYGDHYGEVYLFGDASGNQRSQQNLKNNYKIIEMSFQGRPFTLRKRVPTRNPSNVNNVKALNARLRDQFGNPRIKIHPKRCIQLLNDLTQMVWDPDGKSIRKVRKREDPYFLRTHAAEALMYIVYRMWPLRVEERRETKEEKQYNTFMARKKAMKKKGKKLIGEFPMPGRK
jgi:hypothetical protein